jgi:hypothetical protein
VKRELDTIMPALLFLFSLYQPPQTKLKSNLRKEATLSLIDKADRLHMTSLKQIRALFDEGRAGLVLIGVAATRICHEDRRGSMKKLERERNPAMMRRREWLGRRRKIPFPSL